MLNSSDHGPAFAEKMRHAGLSTAAQNAFQYAYRTLLQGQTGLIPESEIAPVKSLAKLEDVQLSGDPEAGRLAQTVIIKLNGGLGTSMGLERAKSLLPLKEGGTFLDFIARQVLHLRQLHSCPLRFMLMNSFSTSRDTLEYLGRYPELGPSWELELMQNQVPKVDAKTFAPASWPENPQLEWCPPGHGDIYPSLLGSGCLDRLLAAGVRYAFVSNSDNLGATLDGRLLNYFAGSDASFLMEVAMRTPSDRKGGHLAQRPNGKLLLRESAQCPPGDQTTFQDIERHRYFNTNSIWLRLDRLHELLARNDGHVPLPLIKNSKSLDPRKKDSPPVFQLETAMGAAIECFEDAQAIVVPRSRFAPVKTTADLLALRSDAYEVTEDARLVLAPGAESTPPTIELDPAYYQHVDQLDHHLSKGIPSLKHCRKLQIRGPVSFQPGTILRGQVTITNSSSDNKTLPPGLYLDREIKL